MLQGWKNTRNQRLTLINLSFLLGMYGFDWIEHRYFSSRNGPGWYVVAVGFVACFIGGMWSIGLMLYGRHDEFYKALLARATVWSAVATMAAALVWGFLELSGKVFVVPLLVVPAVFFALDYFIFLGLVVRYRVVDE